MSKRLQIIVSEEEAKELKRRADREGLTSSEWARRALRSAGSGKSGPSAEQKLRALEDALRCGHPTADIEEILAQIERGRGLR